MKHRKAGIKDNDLFLLRLDLKVSVRFRMV